MPILVRPVREQLEHDRIIRLLEAKWRRKFKVEANPGDERNAGVKVPAGTLYPDLVLTEEGGRKPKALIEVETNESVNHLEAMAQWANLAKARTSLVLFVPVGAVEAARRLLEVQAAHRVPQPVARRVLLHVVRGRARLRESLLAVVVAVAAVRVRAHVRLEDEQALQAERAGLHGVFL